MTRDQVIDMVGKRFERLLVLCRAGTDEHGNATWVCRCVCSTEKIMTGANLRNGSTRSCGCLNRELTLERNKGLVTHGNARRGKKSSEYQALKNAIYGKRVTVCKRWRDSFPAFVADMGSKPSPAHRLKRLDNSKGYKPANCIWVKKKTSNRGAPGEISPAKSRATEADRSDVKRARRSGPSVVPDQEDEIDLEPTPSAQAQEPFEPALKLFCRSLQNMRR